MNKVDYAEEKRTLEKDFSLADAEIQGLDQTLRTLIASPLGTLSPKERRRIVDQLRQRIEARIKDRTSIWNKQRELDGQCAAGFDYVRPASKLLNRLLPAVPPDTKEVTHDDVAACSTKRYWIPAIVLTIASIGFTLWLLHTLSIGALCGVALLLLGMVTTETSSNIHIVVVLGWFVVVAILVSSIVVHLEANDYPHSRRIARFFLGAERWNWTQRIWVCIVYSVSTPWIVIAPLVIVPIRLMIALVLLWIYLNTEDSPVPAPQAIVTTSRFFGAYQRAMLIGSAVVSTFAVNLL